MNVDDEFFGEPPEDISDQIADSLDPPSENANTSTIKYASVLLNRDADNVFDWKVKELGLRFMLFGLAEVQAVRISRLANLVYKMEGQVFSEETLSSLKGDPRKQLELYRLGVESIKDSSTYVKQTIESMNWDSIEAQLLQISAHEQISSNSTNEEDIIRRISNDILSKFNMNVNKI